MQIDKTSAIQSIIDIVQTRVYHPLFSEKIEYQRPQLMIPNDSFAQSKLNYLVSDFTSIIRDDLRQKEIGTVPNGRTRKKFNHPRDSVMSLIYAIYGLSHLREHYWD